MASFVSDFDLNYPWKPTAPSFPAKWSVETEKQIYSLINKTRKEPVGYSYKTTYGALQTCYVLFDKDGKLVVDTNDNSEVYRYLGVVHARSANKPVVAPVEEKKEDESDDCVVCMTTKKNYIILPCMHMCLCSECVEPTRASTKCPMCRADIVDIKKVFV
jgi:hypothetical protein